MPFCDCGREGGWWSAHGGAGAVVSEALDADAVRIPSSLDETLSDLDELGGVISADRWKTAAFVYAWTEPQQGRRTDFGKEFPKLTLDEFADRSIRGLSSRPSVRRYRRAWEMAVQEGWAEPAQPGQWVDLPTQDFPEISGLQSSASNEWYTPSRYIEAAREVLGDFDLDPASSERANEIVRARAFYTAADDGLAQDWHGRVWMNPPYGGLAGDFVSCLVQHFNQGKVTAAIALLNAYTTDNDWFQPLWDHTLCYTDHRINYLSADGPVKGSTHGDVFAYLGPDPVKFAARFAEFGAVVKRWPDA